MAPDDVTVGQYVTVLGWYDRDTGRWEEDVSIGLFGGTTKKRKRDYVGAVLKVEAVSFPFVGVRDVKGGVIALDVRDVELAVLSPEYVKLWTEAAAAKASEKPDPGRFITLFAGNSDTDNDE